MAFVILERTQTSTTGGKGHSRSQKKAGSLMIRNDLRVCRQGVCNSANTDLLSSSLKTLTRKVTRVVALGDRGKRMQGQSRLALNTVDSENM